ncbi:NADH-ubiquinone oxidoreductase complex I subunit [Novymonas esmeraldas]|uniref:NADH-ubiquinone oxidoreductase complex I subunit n=1 Tax=Novymonas esmeraldas TaxID=1808958 RepID=A0AAW0EP83_9TRYP
MLLRTSASSALRTRGAGAHALGSLSVQQRFLEYWGSGVTGRTQPYAQGDMIPRVDNMRHVVHKASGAAASVTGDPNGIAYDASNIFHAEGFSRLEKEHYQPLRGIATHKVEPLPPHIGNDVTALLKDMAEDGVLEQHWWARVLKDFPSLKTPCTAEFKSAWNDFYIEACGVAHDDEAVKTLGRPFMRTQMQKNFISYAMVWRLAERLCDAFDTAPDITPYEKRGGRLAVERVTKLLLDTIAEEPWACLETTSPLNVDITNFRAWHEAGNW